MLSLMKRIKTDQLKYCDEFPFADDVLSTKHYFSPPICHLLLARLMGQYCFTRGRLSSLSVVCNAAGGRAGRLPGAWTVGAPALHGGGPVR